MTENEKRFWARILEIAQTQLTRATYEFFVLEASLVHVEQGVAVIALDDVDRKRLFWEQNLESVILMAGFEIFNSEISAQFVSKEGLTPSNNVADMVNAPANSSAATLKPIESNLNEKYTFKNFVMGEENKWAVSASIAVADTPGTTYNPLFLWGGPGLGKTHLLNAIGNAVLENNPNARILYITAENFINEFVSHIRLQTMDELKEKFRTLDVLLIDDIQSLAKKTMEGTQEEFFNTFNALHTNDKQIVLTSDRNPDQLQGLPDRLVTRFNWGLPVQITPPDFETRVAILTNKIQAYPYNFPSETIEYLAGEFDSNVRELEGALKNISLVADGKRAHTITVDIVAEAIRSRRHDAPLVTVIPIEDIQRQVGKFYGVTVKEIKATKRTQDIVLARQVAMYLAREMTDNSLPKIGKEFGGRDHSTVLHAYNKIKNMLAQDPNLKIEVDSIKNKIR